MLNKDFQDTVEIGSVILLNKYHPDNISIFKGYARCDSYREHACGVCKGRIMSKPEGGDRIEVGCYRRGSDSYNVKTDIEVKSELFSNEDFLL